MGRDSIDLVLCRHTLGGGTYLFRAPGGSLLTKGDTVIVDTKRGEQAVTVVDIIHYVVDQAEVEFIVEAAGAKLPLRRVLKKVLYQEFEYVEDKHGSED